MDVIAERVFSFRQTGTDADVPVLVRIGRPHLGEHAPGHTTEYEVAGPGSAMLAYYSVGADSLQALVLALELVRSRLDGMRADGVLTWDGGEDLGLPGG
jgi:hypothetical protein